MAIFNKNPLKIGIIQKSVHLGGFIPVQEIRRYVDMKRLLFLLSLIFILGCQTDETPLFIMEYVMEVPFEPSTNTAITYRVKQANIESTYDRKLLEHNLKTEDIKTVRVRSAVLYPDVQRVNYSILRKVDISIFEITDPDDLLVIAEEFPLPNERRGELPMLPGLPNLKRFVEQDFFGLDVGYVLRYPLTERQNNFIRLELEAIGF